MTYTNGMCLKKVRREGSFLHLTLRTWWINYSLSPDEEKGNRIIKTGDLIDVTFGRNLAHREIAAVVAAALMRCARESAHTAERSITWKKTTG